MDDNNSEWDWGRWCKRHHEVRASCGQVTIRGHSAFNTRSVLLLAASALLLLSKRTEDLKNMDFVLSALRWNILRTVLDAQGLCLFRWL